MRTSMPLAAWCPASSRSLRRWQTSSSAADSVADRAGVRPSLEQCGPVALGFERTADLGTVQAELAGEWRRGSAIRRGAAGLLADDGTAGAPALSATQKRALRRGHHSGSARLLSREHV